MQSTTRQTILSSGEEQMVEFASGVLEEIRLVARKMLEAGKTTMRHRVCTITVDRDALRVCFGAINVNGREVYLGCP